MLLPSSPVSWIQLDVLHYAGSVNGSLAAADRCGASDAHRLAYEEDCWQSPSVVHVRDLEQKVSYGLNVAIVHVADVILRRVKDSFLCATFAACMELFHCAMHAYAHESSHIPRFGPIQRSAMFDVGVLQDPPFFVCKTQIAAFITIRAHIGQDPREHGVTSKAHGGLQPADIILVFNHGLRESMLFRLAYRFGEKGAHS